MGLLRIGGRFAFSLCFLYVCINFLHAWRDPKDWWLGGTLYLVVPMAAGAAIDLMLLWLDNGLYDERIEAIKADDVPWFDVVIVRVIGLLLVIPYVGAGYEGKYAFGKLLWPWATSLSPNAQLGIVICSGMAYFFGWFLFAAALYNNDWFSSCVRIQEDRKHQVCDWGLYAYVRHPGYTGMIIVALATGFVLLSGIALVCGVAQVIVFLIRTDLEDEYLQENLPGYAEYTEDVPYKLVPGFW